MQSFILFALLFVIAALASGCQQVNSTPLVNDRGSTSASNAQDQRERDLPTISKKAEPVSETEVAASLATPVEAYKTAHELRRRKDIQGLKKVMSDDIKEFLTMMGEAEKKSLDEMLREMVEKPQAEKAEARNEKIKGSRATIEYLTETGSWKTMDFEKVGGKWLLTFPKADPAEDRDTE